jgi:hypothetical protein
MGDLELDRLLAATRVPVGNTYSISSACRLSWRVMGERD